MASAPHSSVLFENVHRLLSTFIPAPTYQHLYTSIGVKSHGTITCMIEKANIDLLFFLHFGCFLVPDNRSNRAEFIRVPPEASVAHVKELLTRQWCNGVSHQCSIYKVLFDNDDDNLATITRYIDHGWSKRI